MKTNDTNSIEENVQEQAPQNNGGNQYGGGYYSDPFSFFDYFFGNRFGY